MMVERLRKGLGIPSGVAGKNRLGGEARRGERLVHPVPREGIDKPGGISDKENVVARGCRGADASHREAVPAHIGDRGGIDGERASEAGEVPAQVRAFLRPAADPEVRVVCFREQPAVAAGRGAELDHGSRGVAVAVEELPGDVPLERDAAHNSRVQPGGSGDDAVRAVGADDQIGGDRLPADGRPDAARADLDLLNAGVVAKARACRDRLLREVGVESPALGHQDQRFAARAPEAAAVVEAKLERVDDALDNGCDVARCLPERAARDAAAAGLVSREASAIGKENARATASEVDRGRRARGAGADDEDIVVLHVVSLPGSDRTWGSAERSRLWERPSQRRSARSGSGSRRRCSSSGARESGSSGWRGARARRGPARAP